MKKTLGFWRLKRVASLDSSNNSPSNGGGGVPETGDRVPLGPKYQIRMKDLRKIHRAAWTGNVRKARQILFINVYRVNDRDKKKRTALHLACANGHLGVVTLLAEHKCQMNLYDDEHRTALMKAIQCQEDDCAGLLLKHGADPDLRDLDGNTALHYTVLDQNLAIAEQLLFHRADIEAKNKDGLTPLLLAVSENKQQMVEFLIKKKANVHAVDKIKRTSLMLAVNDESSNTVRLLLEKGVDVFSQDDHGMTAGEHALRSASKKNAKLISDYEQERRCEQLSKNSSLVEVSDPIHPREKVVGTESGRNHAQASKTQVPVKLPVDECSEEESSSSFSSESDSADSWAVSDDEDFGFGPKTARKPNLRKLLAAFQESQNKAKSSLGRPGKKTFSEDNKSQRENKDVEAEAIKLVIGKEEHSMDVIESAPQEQRNNTLTYVDGAHKYKRSVKLSALRLGEEEDSSPWDSERCVELVCGAAEQRGKNIHSGPLEGPQLRITSEEEQGECDENENNYLCDVQEQNTPQKTCFQEQNDGKLQGGCRTSDLRKEKEAEIYLKKMNSENLLLSPLGEPELVQTQHPTEDIGLTDQSDPDRAKLESLEKRISQLEGQNKLLQQQLDDACSTHDRPVTNIQLQDVIQILQGMTESASPVEVELNEELISQLSECTAEIKEVLRLQRELGEAQRKQPMSQALEFASHHLLNLETEITDWKTMFEQIASLINGLIENGKTESSDLNTLYKKVASLEQEVLSLSRMRKNHEALRIQAERLKQEYSNLQTYMSMNMVERSELEKQKRDIEEKAREGLEEIVKDVNSFLMEHAECQKSINEAREHHNASISNQRELRNRDLESELFTRFASNMLTESELKRYKHLYRDEVKAKVSLEYQLKQANQREAELRNQLAMERQSTVLSTAVTRPVLEPRWAGSPRICSQCSGRLTPRENVVMPMSTQCQRTTSDNIETYLANMQKELQERIAKELKDLREEDAEEWVMPWSTFRNLSAD